MKIISCLLIMLKIVLHLINQTWRDILKKDTINTRGPPLLNQTDRPDSAL